MKRNLLLDPAPAGTGGGGAASPDPVNPLIAERKRTGEITKIADRLIELHGTRNGGELAKKIRSMANEALTGDESVERFQIRCQEEVLNAKPAKPVLLVDCTDEPGRYSILRGIQSAMKRREAGGAAIPDGQEGEVHQEMLRRAAEFGGLGYEASGFQVPHDAPVRMGRAATGRFTRDMQATVFPQGGAFVPTQLMVPVIEILRNVEVLSKLGVRTMAGLQGNIVIPRQEAAATAYSVSEIGALTKSDQVLGQIALSPKRVGATQTYSKQFLMQSTPDAEAFLRDDLLKVIGLSWDYLGLNGQGAGSEPLGVFNTPGIASIIFGATPTYAKIVSMETVIRAANVRDPLAYVSTSTVKGALKVVAEALTGATTIGGAQNALWKGGNGETPGEVNGYPAWDTQQVPNNKVALGAWSQLIRAMWGGLDIVVDQFTKAANAEWVITINTWGDYAVRHPQAFCVSADAGNQ